MYIQTRRNLFIAVLNYGINLNRQMEIYIVIPTVFFSWK